MTTDIKQQGYFSILRWRSDVTRDEARNVAVILVSDDGRFGEIRTAPLSAISPRLKDQGILDSVLLSLKKQFDSEVKPDLDSLRSLGGRLERSIYLTEPQEVLVKDEKRTIDALYKAYAAPRQRPSPVTKGSLVEQFAQSLRKFGMEARIGQYLDNFLFDITVSSKRKPIVVEVLSFDSPRKEFSPLEFEAGHFLYALERVSASGIGLIEPPTAQRSDNAKQSYERVKKWFSATKLPIAKPSEVIGKGKEEATKRLLDLIN